MNILSIALLISGGYGIKYIFDQKRDIEEARLRQQELLASEQKKVKEITDNITKQNSENKKKTKKTTKNNNKTNIHKDFSKLKATNSDTVGWLAVPGTEINLPIVKGEDNSYYLTHDFDKKYNSMGWVFADSKNTFPNLSTNTIIYGHTYRRTTSYSTLKDVLKDSWLNDKSKQKITFDTESSRLIFQVFSVYTLKATNDYLYISFGSHEAHQKYLDKSLKRSIKNFGVIPTINDRILTLSTCYLDANHRLVVQAKLIDS